ncbi:MAG TPA: hypothetical protein VJ455_02225 [Ignavibacteria bacterium]|nr:hypothetical protein [Ignavibacteria bacterium]
MNNKLYSRLKHFVFLLLIAHCSLLIVGCSGKLDPDPLPLNVKQNLALLQTEPQFVMYFNFKKMRDTGFWKQFISDSLFNAERNFGSFLGILNQAAGVSISNGIDELYFSNSWIGDNALVAKGVFDRKKVDDYVNSDTLFTKIGYPNGITVYKHIESNFNFYFKDDFTLCGSNYLKQIENTFTVTDTSQTGLLANTTTLKEIERIKFKDNIWLISTQKLFIRGIFENFADVGNQRNNKIPGAEKDSLTMDTTSSDSGSELYEIYKKIEALSISLKMTDELEIVMQNECQDEVSSKELKNRMEAVMALAKLSSTFSKKKPGEVIKLLDKVEIDVFGKTTVLSIKLNDSEVTEIRKQKMF